MISRLHELVSNAAENWPDNAALIEAGTPTRSITYRQLEKKVGALADYLLKKGLSKGERVGILSRNSITFAALYFAISRAGGIVVPLNHTLDSLDITKRAKDCGLSALYAGKGFKKKATPILNNRGTVLTVNPDLRPKGVPHTPIVQRCGAPSHTQTCPQRRPTSATEDDTVSIIYTSGTTRDPLGVMLSHKNLISNSRSIVKYMKLTSSDRVCCVLPFYYIYGLSLLFTHILVGGTVIIDNRFMYPNVVLDTIERQKATGFAGVSSHYAIMLYTSGIEKRRLPTLRYFMQAGDKMPPHVTGRLTDAFPGKKLYIMYGQTEASPRLTYLDPSLVKKKPDSIGKSVPGVELKVVNRRGEECKVREEGEIVARGENVMRGYWNNDKETAKVIKNGWLHTGDTAFKDKDGDLFIVGRKKDFIKIGANRVNPLEIEHLIMEDERIMEAAVVGVPDAILGERIKLFVTSVPGKKVRAGEVIRFCRGRLPSYKVPKDAVILKSMPKNSCGKVNKDLLRAK